jgi:hypothetical protein
MRRFAPLVPLLLLLAGCPEGPADRTAAPDPASPEGREAKAAEEAKARAAEEAAAKDAMRTEMRAADPGAKAPAALPEVRYYAFDG